LAHFVAAAGEDGERHGGDAAGWILGGLFDQRHEDFRIDATGDAFDEIGPYPFVGIEV
jgi:hypothetical protein